MRSIYIATTYQNADWVETVLRPMIEARGLSVRSTWHEKASGPERLDELPLSTVMEIAEQNDRELADADAVLVIAHERCRETWAELRLAVILEIPAIVVGPPWPLSAYRHGVSRVRDVATAMDVLVAMRRESMGRAAE